jgi:hypothetical protein
MNGARKVVTMRALFVSTLAVASLSLSGCVARTVANVVTAPVKAGSTAVDLATTSQSEADEQRGRELRQREEKLEKLERDYAEQLTKCREGVRSGCDKARLLYADIQLLKAEATKD